MGKRRLPYLSLAQVELLDDKEFTEYLLALLQLSQEDPEAEALAYNIWQTMTPEQRIIMLKFMGEKASPQGRA